MGERKVSKEELEVDGWCMLMQDLRWDIPRTEKELIRRLGYGGISKEQFNQKTGCKVLPVKLIEAERWKEMKKLASELLKFLYKLEGAIGGSINKEATKLYGELNNLLNEEEK
jgi:hypothetical protein